MWPWNIFRTSLLSHVEVGTDGRCLDSLGRGQPCLRVKGCFIQGHTHPGVPQMHGVNKVMPFWPSARPCMLQSSPLDWQRLSSSFCLSLTIQSWLPPSLLQVIYFLHTNSASVWASGKMQSVTHVYSIRCDYISQVYWCKNRTKFIL